MAGLMSRSQIIDAALDEERESEWIELFKARAFDQLTKGKGIGIFSFDKENVQPIGYDLTVGDQVFSLRKFKKIILTPPELDDSILIEPGDTVLVLTAEYIALSPHFAGVTLARASTMNEGISLSSAKVDPTWHGRLQIPITNNSRMKFKLRRGDRFCTMLLFKLDKPVEPKWYLTQEITHHLGQRTLQFEPRHGFPWHPKTGANVEKHERDELVEFGPPFDVIRAMFEWNFERIIRHMEDRWGPGALNRIREVVVDDTIKHILAYHEKEVKLLEDQLELVREQGKDARSERRTTFSLAIAIIVALMGWALTAVFAAIKLLGQGDVNPG